jgi:YVTN family beta-propeller protein
MRHLLVLVVVVSACSSTALTSATPTTSRVTTTTALITSTTGPSSTTAAATTTATVTTTTAEATSTTVDASAGVYSHTLSAADLSPATQTAKRLVYVPNSEGDSVDVIDPTTYAIIDHFQVGRLPQHIVPAWDLKTLYIDIDKANEIVPIDPATGKPGAAIPVDDPYNLYFTPDGTYAIVVAEARSRLDFYDPHTWKRQFSVQIGHKGVNHMDFSADGKELVASCEFSGWIVKVSIAERKVVAELNVTGEPVDVKLSPDGSVYYVANMHRGGVHVIDATAFKELAFIPTGNGAHGLYPSRDAHKLYVSNRYNGTVSVIDFATRKVDVTWPTGGSPDMGGVSIDGKELWLSSRYSAQVLVIDTRTGDVTHRISVGRGPHGVCLFPQPGRFSMGHTGNFR